MTRNMKEGRGRMMWTKDIYTRNHLKPVYVKSVLFQLVATLNNSTPPRPTGDKLGKGVGVLH